MYVSTYVHTHIPGGSSVRVAQLWGHLRCLQVGLPRRVCPHSACPPHRPIECGLGQPTELHPSAGREQKEMSTNRGKTALHSNTLCSLLQQCFLLLFFLLVRTACPQLVLFSICTYIRGIGVREGLAIWTTSLPRCRCGVLTQRSAPRCSWTDWGCRGGDRCRWQ